MRSEFASPPLAPSTSRRSLEGPWRPTRSRRGERGRPPFRFGDEPRERPDHARVLPCCVAFSAHGGTEPSEARSLRPQPLTFCRSNLFDLDLTPIPSKAEAPTGDPRIERADRMQLRLESRNLDQLVPDEHRVRALWDAVCRLDLTAFYERIRARGVTPGRPAIDPRVLITLWLFATSEGIGSARRLARLCEQHDIYRWICGGITVCHRVLSDFRVGHGAALDGLLTQLLAVLMKAGVVKLKCVAQDGTRVRASAGAASFRRERSLRKCLQQAKQQVQALKQQLHADDDQTTDRRRQAARERAARDRQQRVEEALQALEEVRESRKKNGKTSEPRASTTDPDARVMKMPDGGFRPGYNMQLAVDTDSRIVVAARATNSGGDMGQVEPTVEELERRTGTLPDDYLVDGGYAKRDSIDTLTEQGVRVFAPVLTPSKDRDPAKRQRQDSEHVEAWRTRMDTDEAKKIYKQRCATVETVNGDLKDHRGLERLRVRGIERVQCVLLWTVLAYNLMRTFALAPQLMTG